MIHTLDKRTLTMVFNYIVKLALLTSFFIAIFFPPDVLAGKGMGARAPLFLASAILVPVLFWRGGLYGKKKKLKFTQRKGYPHLADGLLATPFLLDTLGNLFGFYNNYDATDDVLHFVNWVFLVMAYLAFRYRKQKSNKDVVLLGAGFGAIMIIVWEIFEWLISDAGPFAGDVPDALSLTYGDTVGDLAISFSGGLLGAIIARYWFGKKV